MHVQNAIDIMKAVQENFKKKIFKKATTAKCSLFDIF